MLYINFAVCMAECLLHDETPCWQFAILQCKSIDDKQEKLKISLLMRKYNNLFYTKHDLNSACESPWKSQPVRSQDKGGRLGLGSAPPSRKKGSSNTNRNTTGKPPLLDQKVPQGRKRVN